MIEILSTISTQAKNAGTSSVQINGFSVVNDDLVVLFKAIQENGGKFLGWQITGGQKGSNVVLTKVIE